MTLSSEYFDKLYAEHEDPWGLSTRWYERRKYDLTLASLPRQHYHNGFEPGCSIGVLTERLAGRCDHLLAMDVSNASLARAASRGFPPTVRFERGAIPHDWPNEEFDLIVLSEVGYYLSPADFDLVIEQTKRTLTADGHLVAVHWRPDVIDYPRSGDEVHAALRTTSGLHHLAHYRDQYVLLDIFATSATGGLTGPE
jgi:SAM-dependent methyltransferase